MNPLSPPNLPQVGRNVDDNVRRSLDALRSFFLAVAKQGGPVTVRDLQVAGLVDSGGNATSPGPDTSIPPQVTGLEATGAFRTIMLAWNDMHYAGLAYYEIWRSEDSLFTNAARVATTVSTVYGDLPANISTAKTYWYWVRIVSTGGIRGPWSDSVSASTANDPAYLMELLTGQLTSSQLHSELDSRINNLEISGLSVSDLLDHTGEAILQNVLAHRQTTEELYREQIVRALDVVAARTEAANALLLESQSLSTKIADEAAARVAGLAAEASARAAGLAAEATARAQALIDEALARGYDVQTARAATSTLALTLLGADGTSYNSGLIYSERTARTTATDALAQSISLLSAGVDGGFDPADRWEFDDDLCGWLASGCNIAWSGGWLVQSAVTATPARLYINGTTVQGSKYATVKFRIKRASGSGWGVTVDYELSSSGSWTTGKSAAAQTVAVGETVVCTLDFSDTATWKNGTITGIRINTGESTDDAWEFDWIMTGRQSPGVSTATLFEEKNTLAGLISAEADARELLNAALYGADGTATTSGTIYNERQLRLSAEGGLAEDISALDTALRDPVTGAVGSSAAFQGIYSSVTDGITGLAATATRVGDLEVEISGPEGTSGIKAQLAALEEAVAAEDGAVAMKVNSLAAEFPAIGDALLQAALALDGSQGVFSALIQQEAIARAAGDSAEAEQRGLLRVSLDDTQAAIMQEQTARAAALEAEATTRTIMGAQIADSMSAMSQSQAVTASAVASTVSAVNELASRVDNNLAALQMEQTTRATQDEALSQNITTLTADLGNTAALIQQEMVARAAADSAEADLRVALAVVVEDNTAAIAHEETVRAEQDQSILNTVDIYGVVSGEASLQNAIAGDASTGIIAAYIKQARDAIASAELAMVEQSNYLQTQIDNNFAGLLEERRTTTDLISSVASSIDSLAAQFDGNLATLQTQLMVQTSALAVESYERQTLAVSFQDNLNAAIQSESQARASADEAAAATSTTLAAAISGNTVAIQETSEVLTDVSGLLYAQYTVKLDANGKVAGFGLANDGATSAFEILADKFVIAAASAGPTAGCPFYHLTVPTVIDGVTVPAGTYLQSAFIADATITNAKIGSIAADKILAGDVTVALTLTAAGDVSSGNYSAGSVGWRIQSNGNAEFNNLSAFGSVSTSSGSGKRAILDSSSNDLQFYDERNVKRAQLGTVSEASGFATLYLNPDLASGHYGIYSEGSLLTKENLICYGHADISPDENGSKWHVMMSPVGCVGAPGVTEVASPLPGMLAATSWTDVGIGEQTALYFYGYVNGVAAWRRII